MDTRQLHSSRSTKSPPPQLQGQKKAMIPYEQYIHKSRYARWIEELNRREDWTESVDRYVNFFKEKIVAIGGEKLFNEVRKAILDREVMPSMRAFMTAGPALEKDNAAAFNCSYLAVDDPKAFDEALYLSMCGCGVGFSVERQYIALMPSIAEEFYPTDTVIKVRDSKIGWASALRELVSLLYAGKIPSWDLSKLRPKGARLKTFGGRSSGPEPLDVLFKVLVRTFQKAAGRKLNSLECHDIMCFVGDCAVSGGVRRTAMLSLSNLSDDRMRNAKNGPWYTENAQRSNANNSVAYTEKPDVGSFIKEWGTLYESHSGERGIFNRIAANAHAKRTGRRKIEGYDLGTNPCAEILLKSQEFCNLSEVVIRPEDDLKSLKRKVMLATVIGTIQSSCTNFRYLRREWRKNCEEERLLGVSLTGIQDNVLMSTPNAELEKVLEELRNHSIEVNKKAAEKLGISQAASVTCVKPSGTVSQLVGSSSGIHTRYAKYIMRTIREDAGGPISSFLKSQGIRWEPSVQKPGIEDVFYFPIKSPDNSRFRDDLTAIQQLELQHIYIKHWAEHSVSCTVYVKEHEWLEVAAWVYKNFNSFCGVSFLPYDGGIYKQAPYSAITEAEYNRAMETFPKIEWSKLVEFEKEDTTNLKNTVACAGGQCEL